MKKPLAVLLLVLAWLAPTSSWAGNGVSGITVKVYRNLTSVGIKAIVSGDDDSSAVLRLEQRYGTLGQYDSGMVMMRRPGSNIHHGRVMWMTPGRTANFRIVAEDAGGGLSTAWDTVSVAEVRRRPASNIIFYVNQATGNNAFNGLTPGTAKRTFNQTAEGEGALSLLKLQVNQLNAGIVVAPGHYHEQLSLDSGPDGLFHFIAGDGTNPDSTIICGANLNGEADRIDGTTSFTWTAIGFASTYPTTWGVYKAYLPSATSYGDSVGSVTVGFGEYLHKKTSIAAIFADSSGTTGTGLSAGGVGHGWYWIADTLYVRRLNRASPAGVGLHIGYIGPLIDVRKRNWRFSKLTIRYAGAKIVYTACPGTCTSDDNPDNATAAGIVFATNSNASGGVVDSCRFYGNSGPGVMGQYSSAGNVADSITVANSTFDGLTIGTSGYFASKARLDENAGALVSQGAMANIYNNSVTEVANGIQTGVSTAVYTDSTWGSSTEVANNRVTAHCDDGIEVDNGAGINEVVVGNTTDGGNSGISIAPLQEGPLWVLYNTFTRFVSAGVKIGNNGQGTAYLYQNTMASQEPNSRGFEGGSGGYYRSEAANNVFWGEVGIHGLGTTADTASVVAHFNYNCIDSAGSGRLIDRWNHALNVNLNRSVWRAYGNEANGQFGDPGLRNLTRGRAFNNLPTVTPGHLTNYAPNSLVIEKGRRLPGINYGLQGPRWNGLNPTIGSKGCWNCYYPEAP